MRCKMRFKRLVLVMIVIVIIISIIVIIINSSFEGLFPGKREERRDLILTTSKEK